MSEIKTENVAAQPDMKKKRKRNRGKKKPSTKSLINIPGLPAPVRVVSQPPTAKKKELISSNWKNLKQVIAPPKRIEISDSNRTEISPFKRLKLSEDSKVVRKTKTEEMKKPKVVDTKKPKVGDTKKPKVADNKKPKVEDATKVKIEETKTVKDVEIEEPEIWFDDVDPSLIEEANKPTKPVKEKKIKITTETDKSQQSEKSENSDNGLYRKGFTGVTRIIGMDCEMVGVGKGGVDSVVARVSLVNLYGHVLYDSYVSPNEKVTDYRTDVSGIRPYHLENAPSYDEVRQKVMEIINDKILVGHALHNDLKVMALLHPRHMIRDTSKYEPFKLQMGGGTPSLKKLILHYAGIELQDGEHCSVQDARAAVKLYTLHKNEWEVYRRKHYQPKKTKPKYLKKKVELEIPKTSNTETNSFK